MSKGYIAFYLFFCLLIFIATWMLSYGVMQSVLFKDMRILTLVTSSDPLAPFKQVWLYPHNRSVQIAAGLAALPALMIATIAGIAGLRSKGSPLGDARWQTGSEIRRNGLVARYGHIFAKTGRSLLRVNDDRHHLVIGPTRSGKGATYVVPNALYHKGSMIVTDLKSELYELTAGHRKMAGNEVVKFAPGEEYTAQYNPLDFVRQERGYRTTDIQNIAGVLVPKNPNSEYSAFQGAAQQVLGAAISYVLESPLYEGQRHLAAVKSFFNPPLPLQDLIRTIVDKEPGLSQFTIESFNAFLGLPDRTAQSALLNVQDALKIYSNDRVAAATSKTTIDLTALQKRPVTIYLTPNVTDVTLLEPLLTLFVQHSFELLTRKHDPKCGNVFFLLDEFRQLKRMDEVVTKLPYVAGFNIKISFIVQSLANLDEIYGKDAREALLGNCAYQLVLGANDLSTADFVSRSLGKTTIRYKSESRTIERIGLPRRTLVEQIRERDLMMEHEVRQLDGARCILMIEGQRPVLATKLRYFKERRFTKLVKAGQPHTPTAPRVALLPETPPPISIYLPAKEDAAKGGKATPAKPTPPAAAAIAASPASAPAPAVEPPSPDAILQPEAAAVVGAVKSDSDSATAIVPSEAITTVQQATAAISEADRLIEERAAELQKIASGNSVLENHANDVLARMRAKREARQRPAADTKDKEVA